MKALFAKLGIVDMPGFWAFVGQFVKFGIVGLLNSAITLAIYYALVFIGVHYILSYAIGFAISVLNAYYWNSKFVFKLKRKNIPKLLTKIYTSYGFTFLLSTGLLYMMVDIIRISEWIAPLINLCVTVPLNFLLNKFWVFKE